MRSINLVKILYVLDYYYNWRNMCTVINYTHDTVCSKTKFVIFRTLTFLKFDSLKNNKKKKILCTVIGICDDILASISSAIQIFARFECNNNNNKLALAELAHNYWRTSLKIL